LDKAILNTSVNLQGLINELNLDKDETDLRFKRNEFVKIPITYFAKKNKKISLHLLKNVLDKNFGVKFQSTDIKKITSLIDNQAGKSEELSAGLIALRSRDEILIKHKTEKPKLISKQIKAGEKVKIGNKTLSIEKINPANIKIIKDSNIEFISADGLQSIFQIRNWKDGDKFNPIGMKGTKKVSDYLNDIRMDSFEKKNQLVLLNNNKIVWIIGKRLDDNFKITSTTKKALKLIISNG
ncbi:MAG TPA: tRNA lysidine(34) synthetase TilS, partial [Ignavibacteriaceae bacterium]|nr:tRNA lysidine(34) synthetase TilS [Ignavibacteriaceae bacterium]